MDQADSSSFDILPEERLISIEALDGFLKLTIQTDSYLATPIKSWIDSGGSSVDLLSDPDSLRSFIRLIDPDISFPSSQSSPDLSPKGGENILDLIALLSELDGHLGGRYSKAFCSIKDALKGLPRKRDEVVYAEDAERRESDADVIVSPQLLRQIGEMLLIFAVESSRANEIVERIMTSLDAKSQYSIQKTIEKHSGFQIVDDIDEVGGDVSRGAVSFLGAPKRPGRQSSIASALWGLKQKATHKKDDARYNVCIASFATKSLKSL